MTSENQRGPSRSMAVARKEFREIFRDRRTLMNVVISPLVVTPALFALMGGVINSTVAKIRTQQYAVATVGFRPDSPVLAALRKAPNLKLETAAAKAEAERKIQDKRLVAAIVAPANLDAKIAAQGSAPIVVLLDAGDEKSQTASGALEENFRQIGRQIVASRLAAHSLPTDFAAPFSVTEEAIPGGSGPALAILTRLLPYLLIFSAFGGAIYAAFDQVAGEKERGTLETLLVAPISRRAIVLGKFAAVVGVCLVSSVLAIVGLAVPFLSGWKVFDWLAQGGLTLHPAALVVVLIALLPISILFAGALLAVSTFARNQKEAQTYLLTLLPLVMIPALFSMALDSDVGLPVALVPILNAAIIIKQALNGSYNASFIALAFVASAIYAGGALLFATRLFEKESVLIKT